MGIRIPERIDWHPTRLPEDGRAVLFLDLDSSINFARFEPECGQTLKIVSPLGATRLGNFLIGCYWVDLPNYKTDTRLPVDTYDSFTVDEALAKARREFEWRESAARLASTESHRSTRLRSTIVHKW